MNKIIVGLLCFSMSACSLLNIKSENISPYERRAEKTIASDNAIEVDSRDTLTDNKELLQGSHIEINAYNRVVLLTGEVPNAEVKQRVVELIRVIAPIKKVYDYLSVAPVSDFSSRANDALITKTVSNAFQQIHGLPQFNPAIIKVITSHNIVYLMGLVYRDEGNIVVKLTRLQTGVQGIVAIFDYLD
ncbi:MAG: BON domain-containing protein [Methylococcaceae bacterium]